MINDKTKYQISEIFYSIQGEGSRAGLPCVFIRMQECNLKCKWCDTVYAQDMNSGKTLTFDEIIRKVESYNCDFIEFTGGEPLLQDSVNDLINYFIEKKHTVAIETNGSIDISNIPDSAIKIMDIKAPSSGMEKHFLKTNLKYINSKDEVKFVLSDREDYEWAKNKYSELIQVCKPEILFSPAYSIIEPEQLAKWILEDKLKVRLQLQLHKYIWDLNMRGV